jgi:beta-glucosidase
MSRANEGIIKLVFLWLIGKGMKYNFPEEFLWGTSTSALQIESASAEGSCHDWKGLIAKDGTVLNETINHQCHRSYDADIIASLGNAYRGGFDWSRLQKGPKEKLEKEVVDEYRDFYGRLKEKGMHLMLVLHHFANPQWFVEGGSWTSNQAPDIFNDYVKKMAESFGDLANTWNTINEPSAIAVEGYLRGEFPPRKKNPVAAYRVFNTLSKAHKLAYKSLKEICPDAPVGISNNTMSFHDENILGIIPARIVDKLLIDSVEDHFTDSDFIGFSYYGRVSFDPFPLIETDAPGKLDRKKREHDKMWEFYPQGIKDVAMRYNEKYGKPIIVTENGCCTDDDIQRVRSISEHLKYLHEAIHQGANILGYFHWSAFDNFELHLGRSFRFGLVGIDYNSPELRRIPKPSAIYYSQISKNNGLD